MDFLKKQSIFNEFKGKGLQLNQVKKNFGKRIIDLFIHQPKKIKFKRIKFKLDTHDINQVVTVDVTIIDHYKPFNLKSPYKISTKNSSDQTINILYFGKIKHFLANKLKIGCKYRISGKLQFFGKDFQIIHPNEVFVENEFHLFEEKEPEYNLARKKIDKKFFRKLVLQNIEIFKNYNFPSEWIKDEIMKEKNWTSFYESLFKLHLPEKISDNDNELLRKRLAFDELLSNFLIFNSFKKKQKGITEFLLSDFSLSSKIIKKLGFNLTKDQLLATSDIKNELIKKKKIYRLIQGDVGTGKTIVSLLIIADFIKNGYQCVLMAPTEILAQQHFEYFKEILEEEKIKIDLITSKTKNIKVITEKIEKNEIDLLIGTHSVYNKDLKFKKLGLIIIDEQHKFGVNQRIKLLEKSINCHMIIMSATPIPRSLSFATYGEIETSLIKTKPKGRKEVTTSIINIKKIKDLINGIKRKIEKKEQVFWILPNIGDEENFENNEKETVISRFNFLNNIFKDNVAMIHGRMTENLIKKNLEEFKNKTKMILISTTMIEVGINIPSATLIVIEEANKFGLAQLHQLRGRISRSNLPSNCVLIHSHDLSENAIKRLSILKNSHDGFEIAEKDMYLRGPGDFFGTNQSGLPQWRFFEPYRDIDFLEDVKINCHFILENKNENNDKIEFLIKTFYDDKRFLNYLSA